jgi:hypothetical protein
MLSFVDRLLNLFQRAPKIETALPQPYMTKQEAEDLIAEGISKFETNANSVSSKVSKLSNGIDKAEQSMSLDIPFTYGTTAWDKPTDWVIEKFLLKRSVGMVIGEHQSLKTFCFIEVTGCIASGKQFGGLYTQTGLVVIIAAESPDSVPKRLKAFELINDNQYKINKNVIVINIPLCMADPNTVNRLTTFIKNQEEILGINTSLVVFDTFSANAIGIEENVAKEVATYLRGCNELAIELDACVLSVHHHNKSGTFRGSTAFYCNVDLVIEVKRDKRGKQILTDMTVTKSKDGATGAKASLSFSECDIGVKDNAGKSIGVLACNDVLISQDNTEVQLSRVQKDAEMMMELLRTQYGQAKQSEFKQLISESEPDLATATLSNRATAACKLLISAYAVEEFKQGANKSYRLIDNAEV